MTLFSLLIVTQAMVFLMLIFEFLYSFFKKDGQYSTYGTLGNVLRNIGTRIVERILNPLSTTYLFLAYLGVKTSDTGIHPASFFACLFLIDLAYYWAHRLHHTYPFFWIFHSVHHSDDKFNLSTGLRIAWLQELYYTTLLVLPCIVIGFGFSVVAAALYALSIYQFFCHSGYLRLPRFFDLLFVTPHNHSIHHDQVLRNQSSNFGAVFSIWDRLFGTYVPEIASFTPGIKGYHQDNFIKMETDPLREYFGRFLKRSKAAE